MATNTSKRLRQFQRSLYEKAYAEAQALSAMGSPTILNYSEKFEASLPKTFEKTTIEIMLDALNRSLFVLYGDFHTHRQSQKGLVRLLRSFLRRYGQRKLLLAVEMFKGSDQPIINAYLNKQMTDSQLLEKTNYSQNWGFPWKNYKLIVDFATEFNIPLIGINTPNGGKDSLEKRDTYCANLLKEAHRKNPDTLIICLIGEYHLADTHLPAMLEPSRGTNSRCIRVLSNIDRFYFANPPSSRVSPSEYLRLKSNIFCILNSPPWIKWQSYSIWEEIRNVETSEMLVFDTNDADTANFYNEESFDIEYQIENILMNLCTFLGMPLVKNDISGFEVYQSPGEDTFEFLQDKFNLPSKIIDAAINSIALNGFYLTLKGNAFIIEDISLNNLSEISGQFLSNIQQHPRPYNLEREFIYRIFHYAAGVIASKILNPRRKSSNLDAISMFIKKSHGKRLLGHAKRKRVACRAVLRYFTWMDKKIKSSDFRLSQPPTSVYKADEELYFQVSKSLGDLIGFQICEKILNQELSGDALQPFFTGLPTQRAALMKSTYQVFSLIHR